MELVADWLKLSSLKKSVHKPLCLNGFDIHSLDESMVAGFRRF